jgi:hypothetical protein
MRLNRTEGQKYPNNTFIYGRNPDNNGWYFILRLKWLKQIKEICNPYTFYACATECYKVIGYMYRRPAGCSTHKCFNLSTWLPVKRLSEVEVC